MEQNPVDNDIQRFAEKLSNKIAWSIHYSAFNLDYCRQIMVAQLSGRIILPHGLGLDKNTYQSLRKAIDDDDLVHQEVAWYQDDWEFIRQRADFCGELFALKEDERSALINLLLQFKNPQDPSSEQMAIIIATACLTKFHLWESLGLQQRSDLGKIIEHNFPKLYALNRANMRWKRFFYRQLCEQGGDYICRSPSCEECKSYSECFAE